MPTSSFPCLADCSWACALGSILRNRKASNTSERSEGSQHALIIDPRSEPPRSVPEAPRCPACGATSKEARATFCPHCGAPMGHMGKKSPAPEEPDQKDQVCEMPVVCLPPGATSFGSPPSIRKKNTPRRSASPAPPRVSDCAPSPTGELCRSYEWKF